MSNENADRTRTLIQVAFPKDANVIFFTAIVLGVALLGFSTLFGSFVVLNGMQSNLVLCIGAALILGAFGGQATARIGGVIMAGVAAVAIGLFIYLQTSSKSLFLKGAVHDFDYVKYEALDMHLNNRVLGGIDQFRNNARRSAYRFVLFHDEIGSENIEITLTRRPPKNETGANDRNEPVEEDRFLTVPVAKIDQQAFGSGRLLEWWLDEVKVEGEHEPVLRLLATGGREIAREQLTGALETMNRTGMTGPISARSVDGKGDVAQILKRLQLLTLTSPVSAQGSSESVDVELMLQRLKSDDAATRRDARNALTYAPIDSLPRMMRAFREQFDDYRVKLGMCVVLAQKLRADKQQASNISRLLTQDDLPRLIEAAGDRDRSVRVYATEFLVNLGDPRATRLAVSGAAATTDENARYNLVLVARAAWDKLTNEDKRALADALTRTKEQSGTKTRALLDTLKI